MQLIDYDKKHNNYINVNKALSPLYTAIIHLRYDVFSFILEIGFDPSIPDEHGVYLLQYALFLNAYNFIHYLIQSDKIDLKVRIPVIPFELHIDKSQTNETKQLNWQFLNLRIYAKSHTTYLHLAAKYSNAQILKDLIDKKIYGINEADDLGNTLFIEACKSRRKDNISLLFEMDDLDYKHHNKKGQDALAVMNCLLKDEDMIIQNKQECFEKLMNCIHWGDSYFI